MARWRFDQHVKAGAAGLARETGKLLTPSARDPDAIQSSQRNGTALDRPRGRAAAAPNGDLTATPNGNGAATAVSGNGAATAVSGNGAATAVSGNGAATAVSGNGAATAVSGNGRTAAPNGTEQARPGAVAIAPSLIRYSPAWAAAAQRASGLLARPQWRVPALVLAAGAGLALWRAVGWDTFLAIAVSILLGPVLWKIAAWVLHAWRTPDSVVNIRLSWIDLELSPAPAGQPPLELESGRATGELSRLHPRSRAPRWYSRPLAMPGDEPGRRLVRGVLLLAIAVSSVWLAWLKPGPWQQGLVIAVTVALAVALPGWFGRRVVPAARRRLAPPADLLFRRIRLLRRVRLLWVRAPAGGRLTICLLALLNVLIALVMLNAARLPSGLWAIHTKIAFVLMSCLNLLALNSSLSLSRCAKLPASRNSLPAQEVPAAAVAYRSRPASQPPGSQGHADTEPGGVRGQSAKPASTTAAKPGRSGRARRARALGKIHLAVAVGAGILAVGWIGYVHPGLLLILATVAVVAALLSTVRIGRHEAITMLLAIALGIATVDYLGWRLAVTNWPGWWIAVPLLCAEALGALHVLGYQFTIWPRPAPVIEPSEDPTGRKIFLLVPTINEGAVTLRPTLEGCLAARQTYLAQYPDGQVTIVVCNDGRAASFPRWAEIDRLAEELGVRCVTRRERGGAKAGNIENARRECGITGDALMAIFDADQVPKPDFLIKTIEPFADPKVGWVQTGQYYANLGNPVSRWADDQQSMFYNLLCPGKAALNSAFICGTNVVIRAAAMDEIGGLPQDSVTEDFAASITLHRGGVASTCPTYSPRASGRLTSRRI